MLRHSLLVEGFLTAPHGQLDGFRRIGTQLHPIFKPETRSIKDLETVAKMHTGALAYCDELLSAYGPEIVDTPIALDRVQQPLKLLAEKALHVSPAVASALTVERGFNGMGEAPVGKALAVVESQR